MIAHDGKSGTCLVHSVDDAEGFADVGATVYEVVEEEGFAGGVMVSALVVLLITEFGEEFFEGVGVAVDVSDEVVHGGGFVFYVAAFSR